MRDLKDEMSRLIIELGDVNEKINKLKMERYALMSQIVDLLQEIGAFDD